MERWIMNRLGFVNFWVYDTEEFELCDGKLLLRGSNGSGKSITTQSFIPYILDGDRQPTRLDPFGSKDRKMEYYILGDPENGKEESTGYLFLEFVKPESSQYRTIGIGLHAKKGSKMNTWGFCILDGKRIGYDIMLYRNAGDQNIPVDQKNLREQLGDNNIFTDKPTEYKMTVAKYIFGIEKERIEDFDLLTNILIKTRSSKLASKENLKPEQLYAILNESLRPLSDDDLRPMAEAMSRIQDMHRSIDDARCALGDVREIAREYDKYNRYILWKKADAYMNAKNEADSADSKLHETQDKIAELKNGLRRAEQNIADHSRDLQDLNREKKSLHYDDIEGQLRNKGDAEKRLSEEKKKEKDKTEQIESKKASLGKKLSEIEKDKCELEDISYTIKRMTEELESCEEYVPPLHNNYIRGIKFDEKYYEQSDLCRREINGYLSRLGKALDIIRERDAKKAAYDECSEECGRLGKELEKAEDELSKAIKLFDDAKDELIEKSYAAAKSNSEFIIDEQALKKIEGIVSHYEGEGSGYELNNIISERRLYLNSRLSEEICRLRGITDNAQKAYEEADIRLNELLNADEPVPERSELRLKAREMLKSKNIRAKAFYECIDFKEQIDGRTRAVLEAQLSDMGILDALIVPRDMQEKALAELGELSDCIISVHTSDNETCGENAYFTVTADDDIGAEVRRVLQSRCSGSFELNESGYYRNGVLAGHSAAEYEARFIGADSRKKFREYQIYRLRCEIETLREEHRLSKVNYDAAVERKALMDSEYKAFPKASDINSALSMYKNAKFDRDKKKIESDINLEKLSAIKQDYEKKYSEAQLKCRDLPYRISASEYKTAIDEINRYHNDLQDIISRLRIKNEKSEKLFYLREAVGELEDDIDNAEGELGDIKEEIHSLNDTIRLCDEFLNRPENRNVAARVQEISSEIQKLNEQIKSDENTVSECNGKITVYNEELLTLKNSLTGLIANETTLASYFKEECDLGLVITEKELTLKQCYDKAMAAADKELITKNIFDVQHQLNSVFRKYSVSLAAKYNPTLGECFDNDPNITRRRNVITLMWESKPIPPNKFEQYISEAIENDRLLVKSEEEQMFKEILMNTISKKLYYRIADSRRWVESMAELMRGINTSMGLSFSLTWKPKSDIGENELSVNELSSILSKDRELVSSEDYEKLSAHFRSRIEEQQRIAEEQGIELNYSELIKDVLDFRKWFSFRLLWKSAEQDKYRELTVSRFNTFSGGERALSLYIPLFAAVEAQYRKAGEQAPHILALDEAFAGVDDSNISEMFGLLEKLDFGYIVNSQALWGCYDTVSSLAIAELIHEKDSDFITVLKYKWNGRKKSLVI